MPCMLDGIETRVLYNDQCPVCRSEIRSYARYASRQALPIRFEDLNAAGLAARGLTPYRAARRLLVLKDGQLYAGIPAFLVLWRDMPRYRWLARIVALPGIRQAAGLVYETLLAPSIYRWHRRRLRSGLVRPRPEA